MDNSLSPLVKIDGNLTIQKIIAGDCRSHFCEFAEVFRKYRPLRVVGVTGKYQQALLSAPSCIPERQSGMSTYYRFAYE